MQVKHDGQWIRRLSALSKLYFTPTFLGAEYIDASRPAMYVGNHSMYGIFDSPMLIDYLYNEHKVAVVSIADPSHFYVPLWREAVKKFGAVDGIQHYVRAVMQQGYSILVFPGGGREVLKRQGEQYQLIWKQRYGFLKLAQEFSQELFREGIFVKAIGFPTVPVGMARIRVMCSAEHKKEDLEEGG